MSDQQNAVRIFKNIQVLLQVGKFPGEVAPVLAEAQQLVAAMVAPAPETTPTEAPSEQEATV